MLEKDAVNKDNFLLEILMADINIKQNVKMLILTFNHVTFGFLESGIVQVVGDFEVLCDEDIWSKV